MQRALFETCQRTAYQTVSTRWENVWTRQLHIYVCALRIWHRIAAQPRKRKPTVIKLKHASLAAHPDWIVFTGLKTFISGPFFFSSIFSVFIHLESIWACVSPSEYLCRMLFSGSSQTFLYLACREVFILIFFRCCCSHKNAARYLTKLTN